MNKKTFFANVASKALALAATVMMMSTVFTSCSKDNDDDPKPEPKANTVTIDGAERPILKAEYEDRNDGDYILYLYLSADHKEKVTMQLNKDVHMTGSPVNLTEREKKHDGWYWAVEYDKPDGTKLIDAFGNPDDALPVFTTGMLTISGSPEGTINIKLENGRVKGTDSKEHTLTVSYSGSMDKSSETPTPKTQIVIIDGKEKPVLSAEYRNEGGGNYYLYLNLNADGSEYIILAVNQSLHITGTPVKLTQKQNYSWSWEVSYMTSEGKHLFYASGKLTKTELPVFTTGTLTVSGSPEGTINIKLENGRVKGEDGKEHTITANYSGTMTEFGGGGGGTTPTEEYVDLGLSVKWAKCNLGASKPSDYGDYYAWGETEPKADYSWATYKWMQAGQSDEKHITKYTIADGQTDGIWYDAGGKFIGDHKTTLEAADDAAIANLGSPWRMPSFYEIQELRDKCTWTWTTQNGVKGYEVKSKKNGNSIFLPAAGYRKGSVLNNAGSWGYFRSSSLYIGYNHCASNLNFDSDRNDMYNYGKRHLGFSVRPVRP